jgi:hypothetical protein
MARSGNCHSSLLPRAASALAAFPTPWIRCNAHSS